LLDANATETRQHFDDVAATMGRHFEVAAEGLENKIQLVAEAVARVDEKLDRTAADIREEMRRGFGETQAMIKFSHAELDRRMRTLEDSHRALEETVGDLQARVERLESSTH
jgi:chaperonin cofactor prefoldin